MRSVLAQSYCDYELIIVDDGSSDNSLSVVQALVDSIVSDNIRIINQENSGVSTTRNNGVAMASGDYIAFLDADDWWSEDFLEQMVALTVKFPDAGIYGSLYFLVKNGRNRVAPIGVEEGFESGVINYCQLYAKTLCMPLWTGAVVMKKSVFQELGGFKQHLKLGEDFDLWIRIALIYPVALLNKPLAYYNQDADAKNRAVSNKMHEPSVNMLWNLDYLSNEEIRNKDYKYLIDRLRAFGLFPYYLDDNYRAKAELELKKIDWSKLSKSEQRRYNYPLWWLRLHKSFMKQGSKVKQSILKILR